MKEFCEPLRRKTEVVEPRESTAESRGDLHEDDQPLQVDFLKIATDAIEAGVFALNPEVVRRNEEMGRGYTSGQSFSFPETMLEDPYGNGPMQIQRMERDVPQALVDQLRKNIATANRLLLPQRQVMLYFHERFTDDGTFSSRGMKAALKTFSPYVRSHALPDELSFQTEGVDRTSKSRELFTQEEYLAAVELARDDPAIVLTIVAYQGTIQDYLTELGNVFGGLAYHPGYPVNEQDFEHYKEFMENWNTSNFTDELVPAITVLLAKAKRENPDVPKQSLLTRELFQDAVDFIIRNGAFRHFVTVPGYVAVDGKQRVNKFLCPATSTIRHQLLDGTLLHNIYTVTSGRIQEGDAAAIELANTIGTRAEATLQRREEERVWKQKQAEEAAKPTVEIDVENKNWAEIAGSAIGKALEKRKPAVFTFDGMSYVITPENVEGTLSFNKEKQPGDHEVILQVGDWLYSVLKDAITRGIQTKQPVYFSFNTAPWRVDPAEIEAFLQQSIVE